MELNFEDFIMDFNNINVDCIKLDLVLNLNQHLIKLKEEGKKSQSFFNYNKELNLLNQLRTLLINNINSLNININIVFASNRKIKHDLEYKIEEYKNQRTFKIKRFLKDTNIKNYEIYKFKYEKLRSILGELNYILYEINK